MSNTRRVLSALAALAVVALVCVAFVHPRSPLSSVSNVQKAIVEQKNDDTDDESSDDEGMGMGMGMGMGPDLDCTGTRTYNVTFYYMWSGASHPVDYPANGHFSPTVLASHMGSYVVWESGSLASGGIQMVAETGNPTVLQGMLNMAQTSGAVLGHSTSAGPTSSGVEAVWLLVTVDPTRAYISAASMVAPSPDWFTGISSYNLCDRSTGTWKMHAYNYLRAYDAGTDSGVTFLSADEATVPPDDIEAITCGDGVFTACPAGMGMGMGMSKGMGSRQPVDPIGRWSAYLMPTSG